MEDTVEAKSYTDANPLIRFYFNHCLKVAFKGINQLTALYTGQTMSLPVAYELIEKDQLLTDKIKWVSATNKHEWFWQLIYQCLINKLTFRYVLDDSWFSSTDNFDYIAHLKPQFIMPLKSNCRVVLSVNDRTRLQT